MCFTVNYSFIILITAKAISSANVFLSSYNLKCFFKNATINSGNTFFGAQLTEDKHSHLLAIKNLLFLFFAHSHLFLYT